MISNIYHFIRHNNEVELLGDFSNLFEFFPAKHLPDRVVRSVNDNHFGFGVASSSGNIFTISE